MKQLIQTFEVLRAMPGRFLSAAVVVAAVLTFTTPAQADPGHGAVVTHIDRDATGEFWAISSDGQLRLDVAISGRSDYTRLNPDGTLTWQTVDPGALMTLSVLGSDGAWEPMLIGYGTLVFHALVDDDINSTGEATYLAVQGKLTSVDDGSEWSLHVLAVQQDQQFKVLKIDIQPE